MASRHVARTWGIHPGGGYSTVWADLAEGRLTARGRAVGLDPEPYWLTYTLETGEAYATSRLRVTVETATTARILDLRGHEGCWTADGVHRPDLDGALDCDLGLCPLTNTMPVLRHGLHQGAPPVPHHFLMAWVSVPGLDVSPDQQTYTPSPETDTAPASAMSRATSAATSSSTATASSWTTPSWPRPLRADCSPGRVPL